MTDKLTELIAEIRQERQQALEGNMVDLSGIHDGVYALLLHDNIETLLATIEELREGLDKTKELISNKIKWRTARSGGFDVCATDEEKELLKTLNKALNKCNKLAEAGKE